jgi:hypothetical protein
MNGNRLKVVSNGAIEEGERTGDVNWRLGNVSLVWIQSCGAFFAIRIHTSHKGKGTSICRIAIQCVRIVFRGVGYSRQISFLGNIAAAYFSPTHVHLSHAERGHHTRSTALIDATSRVEIVLRDG